MARADRRRAARQARSARAVTTSGGARVAAEQEMFFPKLRKQAKWMFVFLALVFGLGFVLFGVGSGSGGLSDLLQGNFDLFGSSDPAKQQADDARARIAKNPKDATAYRELATALQTQGKHEDAITALEQYRQFRPKDTEALAELASLYFLRAQRAIERRAAIEAAAGPAVATDLFTPQPDSAFGKALSATADRESGFDPVNQAVKTKVDAELQQAVQEAQQAYDSALTTYEAIARQTPNDPNAWSQLAQAAEAAGNVPKAITAYERFLKVAPDDPLAPQVRQRLQQLRQAQPSVTGTAGG
jgi:tetratricopeptide (TPR) repeat protein